MILCFAFLTDLIYRSLKPQCWRWIHRYSTAQKKIRQYRPTIFCYRLIFPLMDFASEKYFVIDGFEFSYRWISPSMNFNIDRFYHWSILPSLYFTLSIDRLACHVHLSLEKKTRNNRQVLRENSSNLVYQNYQINYQIT